MPHYCQDQHSTNHQDLVSLDDTVFQQDNIVLDRLKLKEIISLHRFNRQTTINKPLVFFESIAST